MTGAVHAVARKAGARLRQQRREEQLHPAMTAVAAGLGQLVYDHRHQGLSTAQFVDRGTSVMAGGYSSAMDAGSSDAAADHPDTPVVSFGSEVRQRAEAQQGFLMGLMKSVITGVSSAALANRFGLYAQTLVGAYNSAYGQTVVAANPTYEIVWELGATEKHCAPCLSRAGKVFTMQTLPGWPGDGTFGGVVCSGGARCGCSVSFREGGVEVARAGNTQRENAMSHYDQQNDDAAARRDAAEQARADFVSGLPSRIGSDGTSTQGRALDRDAIRQELADAANARERASGGYQGVTYEPRDIPADEVARILRERGKTL
ncbi:MULTISPECIES: hypothetical protein [Arthrobacter]|uniref:Uncharacterized protein n=1 Tax=Arthrobacter terricola TaxID=2547396 RepID=A0A4R5KQ56_9MICC|nr:MULTISPECIES: hypothetical protein [Arthrobacter]MBT8161003.1 hypothetical protein [Arthrobacter sp. GN70]TDF96867.1 hypothetical protein E1809_09085 [Arthrobacter terricola]